MVTGEEAYAAWHRTWWEHAERLFVDGGSWRHELDPTNRPSSLVWVGRPDTYHAYQATILPLLPLAASYAGALTRDPSEDPPCTNTEPRMLTRNANP